MSTSEDRTRWEQRYESGAGAEDPSDFLMAHADLIRGRVLDVAAGAGRNALFLARRGNRVDAIDVSFTALYRLRTAAAAAGLDVHVVQADLESFPLPTERYDAVINIRYLQRSLFRPFRRALKPGGIVLVETYLIDQQRIGHPRNPAYLLQRGELRAAFADWEILVGEEGLFSVAARPAHLARLIARRPSREQIAARGED